MGGSQWMTLVYQQTLADDRQAFDGIRQSDGRGQLSFIYQGFPRSLFVIVMIEVSCNDNHCTGDNNTPSPLGDDKVNHCAAFPCVQPPNRCLLMYNHTCVCVSLTVWLKM